MKKEIRAIEFSVDSLFKELDSLAEKGVTEVFVHDVSLSKNKAELLRLLSAVEKLDFPLFVSLLTDACALDRELCARASELSCSLEVPLLCQQKGDALLFDRHLYAKKAALLNQAGAVFGFDMDWASQPGDRAKLFRERLDFAVDQYPNHINFRQLEDRSVQKGTAVFSSRDMELCRDIAFACQTFYSEGRAVAWFKSVLESLRIKPSSFFADFAEWQRCNNCSIENDFNPYETPHGEIEKMQLVFLEQKYEEKNRSSLFEAVRDLIVLNGAFSRLVAEGEESVLHLSYSPDDLLSPSACDIASFCDSVPMEDSEVKVYNAGDCPDYRIL